MTRKKLKTNILTNVMLLRVLLNSITAFLTQRSDIGIINEKENVIFAILLFPFLSIHTMDSVLTV